MADEAAQVKRKPTKPRGLKASGGKLWRLISDPAKYELRPDELRILEDACREADLIDEIERQLEGEPFMVTGSQGQDVIHPLIPELRQHRATLTSMLLKLKLPDEPAEAPVANPRSVGARNAANTRWGNSG